MKWIPPDKRPKPPKSEPAYVKPKAVTLKLKISSLKKIWNQFEIVDNIGILLGHYSQTHKRYTFKTNGYQGKKIYTHKRRNCVNEKIIYNNNF